MRREIDIHWVNRYGRDSLDTFCIKRREIGRMRDIKGSIVSTEYDIEIN